MVIIASGLGRCERCTPRGYSEGCGSCFGSGVRLTPAEYAQADAAYAEARRRAEQDARESLEALAP